MWLVYERQAEKRAEHRFRSASMGWFWVSILTVPLKLFVWDFIEWIGDTIRFKDAALMPLGSY